MIEQLIKPELLVLIPVLYAIAEVIKKTPIKTYLIPFILSGVSILLTVVYVIIIGTVGNIWVSIATGAVQGLLIALVTVGANQYVKQIQRAKVETASENSASETDSTATNSDENLK